MKETYALFLKRPGSLAAGVGNYVPEEAPEFVFLQKNHINAKADGIALVDGKSMEPVYHGGDYVYYEEASSANVKHFFTSWQIYLTTHIQRRWDGTTVSDRLSVSVMS